MIFKEHQQYVLLVFVFLSRVIFVCLFVGCCFFVLFCFVCFFFGGGGGAPLFLSFFYHDFQVAPTVCAAPLCVFL